MTGVDSAGQKDICLNKDNGSSAFNTSDTVDNLVINWTGFQVAQRR